MELLLFLVWADTQDKDGERGFRSAAKGATGGLKGAFCAFGIEAVSTLWGVTKQADVLAARWRGQMWLFTHSGVSAEK